MTRRASACGKIILLGEHAVVYGSPAIAIPVPSLRVDAVLSETSTPFQVDAPDIGLKAFLHDLPLDNPLAFCIHLAMETLHMNLPTGCLTIQSQIPVASGLGSGAAVSTAIFRVLGSAAGHDLTPAEVSSLVFEVEQIYHGTPSGVDNTVIGYERPIYFRRGCEPELLTAGAAFHFLIANSGVRSETREAVGGVRERWQADPPRYDRWFAEIGNLADKGRIYLESGEREGLGKTMYECHALLQTIGVATPELDRLIAAARSAGAIGAKLSGAGLGGNVIALVDPQRHAEVESALQASGAVAVYPMSLEP